MTFLLDLFKVLDGASGLFFRFIMFVLWYQSVHSCESHYGRHWSDLLEKGYDSIWTWCLQKLSVFKLASTSDLEFQRVPNLYYYAVF